MPHAGPPGQHEYLDFRNSNYPARLLHLERQRRPNLKIFQEKRAIKFSEDFVRGKFSLKKVINFLLHLEFWSRNVEYTSVANFEHI